MNIKVLFLHLPLIISGSLPATVQDPNPLLAQIMKEYFNRDATDQDLIEARDARGYTIFHVIIEKMALAPHTSDLINLLKTGTSIAQPIREQVNQALKKEGRSTNVDLNSLLKQYESNPEKSELIKANMALLNLCQETTIYQKQNSRSALTAALWVITGVGIGILCSKCFNL